MRPNFALNILADGLHLLHRASPGWERVGEVSFEEDLTAGLDRLRRLGEALDPAPMRTKLILPNEQIRYMSVFTGATTEDDRRALVMSELDGATPYALKDLAICWSVSGTTTHIAAVARETLEEAESFAAENGLNPVSFVAIPGEASYLGEPFFGPTRLADSLLKGETLERDAVQVHEIGKARLPDLPAAAPEAVTRPADAPAQAPGPQGTAPTSPAPQPPAPRATPDTASDAPAKPDIPARKIPKTPDTASDAPTKPAKRPAAPGPSAASAAPDETAGDDGPPPTFRARRDLFDHPEALPKARPTPRPTPAKPAPAGTADKGRDASSAPAGGFVSIRADRGDTPPPPPARGKARSTKGPTTPKESPAAEPAAYAVAKASAQTPPAAAKKKTAPVARPAPTEAPAAPRATRKAPDAEQQRAQEAEQLTVFGARPSQQDVPPKEGRRLHRLALAAAGVAVVALGAWAFLGGGEEAAVPQATTSEIAEAETPQAQPPQDDTTADESQQAALVPDPEAAAEPTPSPEVTVEEVPPAEQAPAEPEESREAAAPAPPETPMNIRPAPATPAEAAARYAATGIWQRAPQAPVSPVATPLGEIEVAAMAPADRVEGVTGLADTNQSSPLVSFSSPPNPPLPSQRFDLDARGLVAGTEDGARTPEGHLVFAGPPPVVPPSRPEATRVPGDSAADLLPAALTPPATEAPEDTAPQATEDSETAIATEPAEEIAADTVEEIVTAPEDQLRPRLRPEGLAPESEADPEAEAETTDGAAEDGSEETQPELEDTGTDLATDLALRPRPRPDGFEALVAAAQAAAVAPPTVSIPSPTVSPSAPSQPSVARQATVENAINLNNVNLIGVTGSPSERTALVRLPDGRIRSVQVGDRLDGGRVAAIGDTALRYVKGNRNLLLEMPD
ncbi:hypothetical protein [Pseudooceanicola marinus]|uniref:hypothetical protein n=1 Tax=Pseudooceanicola marinus TaxID=396013 RepID=UPI001CD6C9FB|nr:hypothetical protein [Pseudooceanicola marinus]MCA1337110.1 hypothetical protein [Pseudooceanicola marinus]